MAALGTSDKKMEVNKSSSKRDLKLIKTGSLPEGAIPNRIDMGVVRKSAMVGILESTVTSNNSSSVSDN